MKNKLASGGQKPFREKVSGLPKAFYEGDGKGTILKKSSKGNKRENHRHNPGKDAKQ